MIDQAFVAAFIAEGFGLPIAHENTDYTANETPFVEIVVQQNPISPLSMSNSDQTTGFFQFALRYPLETGAITAKAMCETIFAAFPLGRVLTYSGQSAQITGKHRVTNQPDGGAYLVIGRLFYAAHQPR